MKGPGSAAFEVRRVVVFADDDPHCLSALRRSLRKHAAWLDVVMLDGAVQLGNYLTGGAADLLVVDAYMPLTNGVEACRQLRAAGVETPLVLTSCMMTPELEAAALSAGATYALPKPVDVIALITPAALLEVLEPELRQQLVEDHLAVAHNIARGLVRRYGWILDADDIAGCAMVGLCEAAARFERDHGEPFVAFAEQRIRGAVLDEVRRQGTSGRVANKRQRCISEARRALTSTGQEATEQNIAEHLGLSLSQVRGAGQRSPRVVCDDVASLPSTSASPAECVERAQFSSGLTRARDILPALEATVIRLRYDEEMSLPSIARTLQLTLGRIRYVHATGLARLRACIDGPAHAALSAG